MCEVVVVGSCMIDLVSYVSRLPKPGETIKGHYFTQGFGGKGANQCVMARRLGATTGIVARLGNDSFGIDTVKNFESNEVNIDRLSITDKASSGVAQITVNNHGENAIVIISGANNFLSPEDVNAASDMVATAKVVVCQLEVPLETTLKALEIGKKGGVFNAAPGCDKLMKEIYEYSDILCVNETEAEILSGVLVTDIESGITAVKALQQKGPGCVVLTMGSAGVLFTELGANISNVHVHHIPAITVDVVDTTGAGDAFVGALAYYLSRHSSLSFTEKIRRSSVIASHTVTLRGTQTSFVTDLLPNDLLN